MSVAKIWQAHLFYFWTVRELGVSLRELAMSLEMSPPGVGFSVERGEAIGREKRNQLIELYITVLPTFH
jgi:hypothetical protein